MKYHFLIRSISLCMTILWLVPVTVDAHHFRGLPHYNYYEDYPEVPEDEFLGQVGDYEVSLVVYDFQEIQLNDVDEPGTARMFLVIFNLRSNDIYGGPLTLELLDKGKVIHKERHKASESENLYSMHQRLPEAGKYSLRLTLHSVDDLQCEIPFTLSSQKIHWGKWIAGVLFVLIAILAVAARRAKIAIDQKEDAGKRLLTPEL